MRDGEVGDLVSGVDVVDFAWNTVVEDRVEGVGGIGGVEIATGVVACAVDVKREGAIEEGGEFGDDF